MPRHKLSMRRKASDNLYRHRDFHNALNIGLEYVRRRYGKAAVKEYLRQFAAAFYAPLTRQIRRRGLIALKEHLQRIYAAEGGRIRISCSRDELCLQTQFCPAVRHLRRKMAVPVSPLFVETERTVYAGICAGTPFSHELLAYDPGTGRSTQRFYRRKP